MSLPKSSVGLACILVSVIVTRIAVSEASLPSSADPAQIWFSLSSKLKAMVLFSALLFVAGVVMLIRAVIGQFSRKRG